jgi:hypothetical protein
MTEHHWQPPEPRGYEPEDEDEDADDIYGDPQPDHFCECRPGRELRHAHQHAPDCPRWMPPLQGPGSTPEGRAAALAAAREAIAAARRHHQEQP